MTSTPPVGAAEPQSSQAASTPSNPNGVLGQNDFLKLMVAQLQSQDPLQPANTNEYISEIAQFTQVEQLTNLAASSELAGGVQLIGRSVSFTGSTGAVESGKVESVQSSASGTTVTVEGQPGISLTSIKEVQ